MIASQLAAADNFITLNTSTRTLPSVTRQMLPQLVPVIVLQSVLWGNVFFLCVSHPFTTTINILGSTLNVINKGDLQYSSSNVPAIGNQDADYGTNADLVLNINASTGDTVINAYTTGSNAATIGKGLCSYKR